MIQEQLCSRFDALCLGCAALLLLGAAFTGASRGIPVSESHATSGSAQAAITDLSRARAALDAGKTNKAIGQLAAFVTAHSDVAEGHILLAKAYASLDDKAGAIKEFRKGVVLDQEYADLNSDKYVGREIKAVLPSGSASRQDAADPARIDALHAATLDDVTYLQRVLAGGCN